MNSVARSNLSKTDLQKFRQSWKEAIALNNERKSRLYTVFNLKDTPTAILFPTSYPNSTYYICEYYNFDVFCLSETKLDDSFTDSFFSINDNFSILRKDRNSHGGGVGGTTIRIITAYHPNHGHSKSTLFDTLEYLLIPGKHTVMLGDFNMPCIDWNLLSAPDKACSDFIDFVVKHGLTQSVKSPTRFNPEHILDLCLSNTGIINDVSVGDLFSDHCLIKVVLSCDRKSLKSLRKMINYRKGDYDSMNGILSRIDWPLLLANLPTNDMYSLFIGYLKELIYNYVPILEIDDSKVRHSPAIIYYRSGDENLEKRSDSIHYKSICASIKELLLEEHKKKFEDKLVEGNPKNFFKLINRKLKPSNFVGPIKSGNGILCDDHEKAECILNTFFEVFVSDDGLTPSIEPRTTTLIDEVSYEPYVIEYALSKLEPKCNNSPDGIPYIILKKLGELLRWINDFLSGRSQTVLLNGVCSSTSSIGSGVPQGSVLGPLLFILFINDIGDKLESESLLYADDLKIISPNAATNQKDLMKLSERGQTWQMKVAPSKCEYITFVKSKRTTVRVISIRCEHRLIAEQMMTVWNRKESGSLHLKRPGAISSQYQIVAHNKPCLHKNMRYEQLLDDVKIFKMRLSNKIKCFPSLEKMFLDYSRNAFV
ncbi:hypothetical protein CRE_26940 [Caenorhabditis remanei]|uniref:Reverse transcriptase domain-containing protein n=1 Tax=Caenorhabditis remanei TaxID=31234 RepID=E3LPE2_CAERE|nr:hypothetical protein CRE_26940 [Caenorhabditis remanei]